MIIAQNMTIVAEQVPAFYRHLKKEGYALKTAPDNSYVDCTHPTDTGASFRCLFSAGGSIVKIEEVNDHPFFWMIVSTIYPFARVGSYLYFTGEQGQLIGYHLGPDGAYEACNVRVVSELGRKMTN